MFRIGYLEKYSAVDNFPDYSIAKCLVEKFLTPELYGKLYKKVTPHGVTLDMCIQPSCEFTGHDPDTVVGLVAGDQECYEVFKDIFDPILDRWHFGFKPTDKHPAPELDASALKDGHLDGNYVKSCRVRTGRSISGFCFAPAICRAERREVERILSTALGKLSGELKGQYFPLAKITPEQEKALDQDHFYFPKPRGHFMRNANAIRDWPDGRGIWHNEKKNFLVWINEEDHCRVISMQKGGDMKATFERFCTGLKQIEGIMKESGREFMHSDRLGYLCMCPTNVGTVLRCSVHVELKHISKHPKFDAIVKALSLEKRGIAGEFTDNPDDIYDLSNAARLKLTEREFVQLVVDGVKMIIEMDKALAAGKSIDDMLPAGAK